VEQLEERA